MTQQPPKIHWNILLPLAVVKLFTHFLTNTNYGLHRDEYLYIAESDHLSWGYMEVPPMIALLGKVATTLMGNNVFAVRFFPALVGAISIILLGMMVRDMGGRKYAQLIAGGAFLLSPAFLGSNTLFQPVSFNQFCWLLSAFFVVKILRYGQPKYWYYLGIVAGLGFLTKYSIVFFFVGLIGGFLLTPHRKVFATKYPYIALAIGLLIASPNLWWQFQYDWPVVRHMEDLAASQLVNVRVMDFIIPQFLFHFGGVLIWVAGLYYFFQSKTWRVLGWAYLIVVLLLLALSGKDYYTIGAYSMLFAGGGIFWEQKLGQKSWLILIPIFLINLIALPFSLPILPVDKMQQYCIFMKNNLKIEAPMRWEDGVVRDLTQDYADMHGWEEIPEKVAKIYHSLTPEQQKKCMIYGGHYGQAGVINFYRKKYDLPEAYSFNSSFVMWLPEDLDFEYQIQVDDNKQTSSSFFKNIELRDSIENEYARDPGWIYFKSGAKGDLKPVWKELVLERKREAGIK